MKHRVHVCLILRLFVAGIILFGTQRSATGQNLERADSVFPSQQGHSPEVSAKASTDESRARVADAFARLPLSFEANGGQADPQVKFLARGQGYTLFLTRRGEAVLTLSKPLGKEDSLQPGSGITAAKPTLETAKPSAMVRMSLVGAAATPQLDGVDKLSGKANYFVGNDPKQWNTNVPLFAKVKVRDIYPGVDLLYYGSQQQLEYDFIVEPGGDSHFITMNFSGAKNLSLDAQGDLVLRVDNKDVRLLKPVAYQEVDGQKREVASSYELKGARQVGFHVTAYDHSRPLIIDPVLSYSTYLGGNAAGGTTGDYGSGIAVDSGGNAYVTGLTQSTNFPTTSGAFQTTGPPACNPIYSRCTTVDAFVTKLSADGSALVYSTYLGGSGENDGRSIAVDSAGNAYVTGRTNSGDFPTTPGAFQPALHSLSGGYNAFVTKLSADGSGLIYSTYLGGSGGHLDLFGASVGGDQALGIAVDGQGEAYLTGFTTSRNFPTTAGAFQTTNHSSDQLNGTNAFVTKVNSSGSGLVYSSYLGGSGAPGGYSDWGSGIALDSASNAYIVGCTGSSDFPTTPGAFQFTQPIPVPGPASTGIGDGFVTKMNTAGSGLVYSTYLGGNDFDWAIAVAVDSDGNAYITGNTGSIDFPTTPLAFQFLAPANGPGDNDAFVTKLNNTGTLLVYSTYLGGSADESGNSIAIDSAGDAFVTGTTYSNNFPITPNAIQPAPAGGGDPDAFVLALNPQGTALVYSSYLGASGGYTLGAKIALDSSSSAYVVGTTSSASFPTTPGAFQSTAPQPQGHTAGFVTKVANITCGTSCP